MDFRMGHSWVECGYTKTELSFYYLLKCYICKMTMAVSALLASKHGRWSYKGTKVGGVHPSIESLVPFLTLELVRLVQRSHI